MANLRERLDPLDHWKYIDVLDSILDAYQTYAATQGDMLDALDALTSIGEDLENAGLLDIDEEEN